MYGSFVRKGEKLRCAFARILSLISLQQLPVLIRVGPTRLYRC